MTGAVNSPGGQPPSHAPVKSVSAQVVPVAAQSIIQSVGATVPNSAPPVKAGPLSDCTIQAQQVAKKCNNLVTGTLGRSGAFLKKQVAADKEESLGEQFMAIRDVLCKRGIVPADTRSLFINPELLLARYVDPVDGQVKEVSLLDAYLTPEDGVDPKESFKGMLDEMNKSLREALKLPDDSPLSSLRMPSQPIRSLRRSWNDTQFMHTNLKIDALRAYGPLTKAQDNERTRLEEELSLHTLHNEKYFRKAIKKFTSNLPSSCVDNRFRRAEEVVGKLDQKLKEKISELESQPGSDLHQIISLKQLQYRLKELDGYALSKALSVYPDHSSGSYPTIDKLKESVKDLHEDVDQEYKKKRKEHQKQAGSHKIAPHDSSYAVDVAGLLFSANAFQSQESATALQDYYKLQNMAARAPSLIDDIFAAVIASDKQGEAENAAETLAKSSALGSVDDSFRDELKGFILQALQNNR